MVESVDAPEEDAPGGSRGADSVSATSARRGEYDSESAVNWGNVLVLLAAVVAVALLCAVAWVWAADIVGGGRVRRRGGRDGAAAGRKGRGGGGGDGGPNVDRMRDEEDGPAGPTSGSSPGDEGRGEGSSSRERALMTVSIVAICIGLAISIYVNSTCDFASVDTDRNDELLSVGLWSVSYQRGAPSLPRNVPAESCTTYFPPTFDRDAAYKLAMASGVLSSVLGGISLASVVYVLCRPSRVASRGGGGAPRRSIVRSTAPPPLLLLACAFQGLTLIVPSAGPCGGGACSLGYGGAASAVGVFYWLIGAGALASRRPPRLD